MAFTPQELQGGKRYNSCTLIGNWFEARCMRDELREAFKQRKAQGLLSSSRKAQILEAALQPQQSTRIGKRQNAAEIPKQTEPADAKQTENETHEPYVKFGSCLGLYSVSSCGLLAALPVSACLSFSLNEAAEAAAAEAVAVVSKPSAPVWRNTFIIESCSEKKPEDNCLRFGDSIRISTLAAHNGLAKCFLCCEPLAAPKKGRGSPVFWGVSSPSATWIIEAAKTGLRYEAHGDRVSSTTPFVLRHEASGECLSASSKENVFGHFGQEGAVTVQDAVLPSLPCLSELFLQGKWTPDQPVKQQGKANVWCFVDANFFEALRETP